MKTMIRVGIMIAACCMCALAADIPRHLVVLGGPFGNIDFEFASPDGVIRCERIDIANKATELVSGTNVTCVLALGGDGAVHTLRLGSPGGYDVDFVTRIVDGKTGEKRIMNPEVVLEGKTNGIVTVWRELGKTDSRFVVKQLNGLDEPRSNNPAHATGKPAPGR